MVGYQIYPKYINSGVAWMGDVPEHWVPIRFKHRLLEKKKVSNSGLDAGSISFGRVIFKVAENLAPETKASYQEVLAGEFLINPLNMNYDLLSLRTALSAIDVVVSTGYIVIRSEDNLVKRYIRWLLQEFDVAHMKTLGSGVRQTINYMDIGNSFFYEPPKDEQQKIANFLDHETAKIDTLIDKQQQLITLLKEKRQAVISHAVTKGLNPKAPMRDSGVEWLGEVPAHWTLPKIKWFYETESGGTPNTSNFEGYYQDGEIPWIRTTDLNNGDLYETPLAITDKAVADSACSILPVNSVLVAMYGGAGTIGKHSLLKFESTINQAVCAILPIEKIDPEYMHLYVEFYRPYWMVGAEGTRKDPNINQEVVRELMVPCPPSNEQIDIVRVTKKKLTVIDEIVFKSESNIQLMQERRTALISAAVTGKIDVRNWQEPIIQKQEVK
jgi:type I restriction enzyme S subunit